MDTAAARRARQKALKEDLAEAYDDEEASPPEWVYLLSQTRDEKSTIREAVHAATESFANEPDIRKALAARERFVAKTTERITELNRLIRRLNQIAPHPRFERVEIDADETLRPLFRTRRAAADR